MTEVTRQQLPYLRRFARALLGRQAAADRLVARAIEAVGAERAAAGAVLDDAAACRRQLFRALVDAHASAPGRSSGDATAADEGIVATRVRALPMETATSLLLSTLEGFAPAEIAFIMRRSPAAAEALLLAAQDVLDAQAATDILVIEDEPVIAMDIVGIVRQAGHRVLGIAATRTQAVAMAAARPPGLILADIALADASSGIAAVDDILASLAEACPDAAPIPVIFVTAYPERLVTDERLEPSLLITKPFSEHLLRVAIAQALEMAGASRSAAA